MNNKLFHFNPEDTKAVDSIINESLDDFVLREGVVFKKKLQTPYKGWIAVFYDNFVLKSLFYQSEHGSKLIEANWSECGKPVNKISKIENVLSMFFEKDGEILKKGFFKESLKEGLWKSYRLDAQKNWIPFEERNFRDGLEFGPYHHEDEHGAKTTASYYRGHLHGEYHWTASKNSSHELQYLIDSILLYFLDGGRIHDTEISYIIDLAVKHIIGNYQQGTMHGEWYFQTSNMNVVGNFVEGVPEGVWKLIKSDDEKVLLEGKMKAGRKSGTWIQIPDSIEPNFFKFT